MAADSRTGPVLYGILADPNDAHAWGEFVKHYRPRIKAWCTAWCRQDADAEDVCQTVLYKLLKELQTFEYDPKRGKFRSWLKTVARNVWINMANSREPRGFGGSASLDVVRSDWERMLEEFWDQELFAEAVKDVRARVEVKTWEAFQGYVLEDRPVQEVAKATGKSVASIYMIKRRLKNMLKAQIDKLDGNGETGNLT